MSQTDTAPAKSSFVCAYTTDPLSDEDARLGCAGREYGKTAYCVFHYPNNDKSSDFEEALASRLEKDNFNFQGVWFPDAFEFPKRFNFSSQAHFDHAFFNAHANFTDVVFKEGANFCSATFNARANFDNVKFCGRVTFEAVTFRARTSFHSAVFSNSVTFFSATFHDRANFDYATFNAKATFRLTNFKDYVSFKGTNDIHVFGDLSWLDFREVKIDKPELVSFHTLALRPHWFVDANASSFVMKNVEWHYGTVGESMRMGAEIDELAK